MPENKRLIPSPKAGGSRQHAHTVCSDTFCRSMYPDFLNRYICIYIYLLWPYCPHPLFLASVRLCVVPPEHSPSAMTKQCALWASRLRISPSCKPSRSPEKFCRAGSETFWRWTRPLLLERSQL